jgi:uncharacterized protein
MSLLFEWDDTKARSNFRKHRVSFNEAQTVFLDEFSMTVRDPEHSQDESRFRIVGMSNNNRVLVVSFTERRQKLRLISARKAIRSEIKTYEEKGFD